MKYLLLLCLCGMAAGQSAVPAHDNWRELVPCPQGLLCDLPAAQWTCDDPDAVLMPPTESGKHWCVKFETERAAEPYKPFSCYSGTTEVRCNPRQLAFMVDEDSWYYQIGLQSFMARAGKVGW